nr:olfactory receptor 5V1-like [Anolis sagrei ordinatus]
MDIKNQTELTNFILLGFSTLEDINILVFVGFLAIYLFTVMWNAFIILITILDQRLKTPMYFFLGNLSFLDISYTTTTVPQMLGHLLTEKNSISYMGCVFQLYFFFSLLGTECLLLAVMAFDRYVAICNPLRYMEIISKSTCFQLSLVCWAGGFLNSAIHTVYTFRLPFCGNNQIDAFYCDIPPLLKLSCGDISLNQMLLLYIGLLIAWAPFISILVSYAYIIATVLKIHSPGGKQKAFSTCTSHLTVVLLYYGSAIFSYLKPISTDSSNNSRLIPLIYSILTPLLNPVIYTLRNHDVKKAWQNMISKF